MSKAKEMSLQAWGVPIPACVCFHYDKQFQQRGKGPIESKHQNTFYLENLFYNNMLRKYSSF